MVIIRIKPSGILIRRFIDRRRAAVEVESENGADREKIPISIIKSIGIYKGSTVDGSGDANGA